MDFFGLHFPVFGVTSGGRWPRALAPILTLGLAVGLGGCAEGYFTPDRRKAEVLSHQAGWDYRQIAAPPFTVAAAVAPSRAGAGVLTVYIEGDGLAFLGPHTVSADPTPNDPVALRMALAHPGGAAAYLARPCQYLMAGPCRPAYWTSHRYAAEIVAGMSQAVDELKRGVGAERVILVGYSGGGAVAVLVASRRKDVAGVVTVAANLDLAVWTQAKGLSALTGSLDPAGVAAEVAAIPQVHFIGGKDDTVPAEVGQSYLRRAGIGSRARLVTLADFGHACCWAEEWRRLAGDAALSAIADWPVAGRSGG